MTEAETPAPRRRSLPAIIVTIIAIIAIAAVAFSVGRLTTLGDTTPANVSAEAGFARDMQTHHDQGVELSMIVRDLTDDYATRLLAYDIATTQGNQSGQMAGWLGVWGLPQAAPEASMTWMTRPGLKGEAHNHGTADGAAHVVGDPMPGLATSEQIAHLKTLSGTAAEVDFLTLMIAHHRGAIDMAKAVLDRSTNTVVVDFANAVIASQQSEIDLMESMIAERS